jgi:hypothetical protein
MADFNQIRQQLRKSRDLRDKASQAATAAQEQLKRIAARQSELNRVFNPRNQQHIVDRERLQQERASAEAELQRQREFRASSIADEASILGQFALFTDPRKGIEQLHDSTPILLMPVRLETRFKTSTVRTGKAVHQLWVRIYPDDCWIDSFDPTLTETEVSNATTYWISIWQAGGFEDQELSAWQILATRHGSGRAAWIVSQFQPANLAQKPSKPRAKDVILTIQTDTPLLFPEDDATANFWINTWLADGDANKVAAATATLESALGQARAAEIVAQYIPANFASPLAKDETKQTVNVSVAYVILPVVDTKQSAWSQAPKATILPDRFVFIGYETENDDTPTIEIGNHVPSPLLTGPDPTADKADQIQHDAAGDVVMPDEMKWISDFDRAVDVGMGFRINLSETQATRGFKRVLVVGLRVNADEQAAKSELETLFRHHSFSRNGLAIVPQGTPTNNTEATNSGASRLDNPEQSFADLKNPLFAPEPGWIDKKDGQWLAEYLGIDPKLFLNTNQAGSTDQLTARAMNIALWPATLGYWMESMMAPVFTRGGVEQARKFFNRFVIAGGACPAIRIGSQPYGILPATTISRMAWINQSFSRNDHAFLSPVVPADPTLTFLRQLYPILLGVDKDFEAKLPEIPFVGQSGDPHAMLLDIIGLHSGSVEWSQRYAESLRTVFNRLNLRGLGGFIDEIILSVKRIAARDQLTHLGYSGEKDPPILDLIFNGKHNQLKGGVVDDVPLSETKLIRSYTADGRNYIQYLIDASNTSLDALYSQEGFQADKPPTALLYLFLRHALQLGYYDVSIRLYEGAGLYDSAKALAARIDDPFLHIRNNQSVSESRYEPLYSIAPQITGNSTVAVHQFITAQLSTLVFARYLREQVEAMQRLKSQSTARLERAFADHIDCCSYRLDAWFLGLVNYQLSLMRNIRDGAVVPARQGIYLGAYAWLEDLKPENKVLTPVVLTDSDLAAKFNAPGDPPLMRDSTNEGYIHAASLNHAVAAAVLRNGFISNASSANPTTMAVNLTSERVRTALAMIEGIRAGQGLSDLLGYQFERGLHDRHNVAEVDQFIYKLRRAFPIRADRMNSTKPPEGVSIEAIEARNVINGLALVEHIKAVNNKLYPFGKDSLPPVTTQAQADAINAEVDRLLESHDAVADLALSEGVYQAVLGNYDRVASTYDAYARGNFPPEPDVVRTPLNGIGLTHRVALHLVAGASPNVSPVAGLPMTPRAKAEPALNRWLHATLPPLDQIGCLVSFRDAATAADVVRQVTLRQLELQPCDLLAIVGEDLRQSMTELDDRVTRFAILNFGARPDITPTIRYLEKTSAAASVFQCLPLFRSVRRLTSTSRALQATDLTLMNEATSGKDSQPLVDKTRLDLVLAAMQTLRNDFAAFKAGIDAPLGDLLNRRAEILTDSDSYVTSIADLLARAATFAIPQSGWGFAYDFRHRVFAAILEQSAALVTRWDGKLAECNSRLADAAAATTDDARFAFLAQAERAISTEETKPRPATPALYLVAIGVKQNAFVAKRSQVDAVRSTTRTSVSLLLADVRALLPFTDFDLAEFNLTSYEDEMVRFTQDTSTVAGVIIAELDRGVGACAALFAEYLGSVVPSARAKTLENAAKVLLGEDFHIFPEFNLTAAQGDEFENALAASRSGDLFDYLTNPPEPERDPLDFPVDTWLYGVARVRQKIHSWEQILIFSDVLGGTEPGLDALQLPFIPGDRWLGLEFPPGMKLDRDRLLYTAHFAAPFNKAAPQCGMLLDEWTETIPTPSVDTGITFHHDRPNCEAPQSMLLVTPSEFRGAWRWNDLVGALNETLDFSKRRAVEPKHLDNSAYAPLLPATVIATQVHQLTIAVELGLNNRIKV